MSDAAVRRLLVTRGVPEEVIEHAATQGRLHVLAMTSVAMPDEPRYTIDEVADRVGMDGDLVGRFWRALGFSDVGDERAFREQDVDALLAVKGLIELGLSEVDIAVQMTRVVGSSMARVAEAQVQAAATRRPAPALAELAAAGAHSYLDTQAELLEYVWRRHLEAAGRRLVLAAGAAGEGAGADLTVGFADLVGFTAMSQQLPQDELASLVARFEEVAYDQVAARGGRVAKMIGDEVMFVVEDPRAGVEVGLALAEAYASDDRLSDVRVGLASGPVLAREGDFYGPVVNLASRIVAIAYPGTVVVGDEVHRVLAGDETLRFVRMRPRYLKDIGRVQLWHVHRPDQDTEAARAAERRRRTRVLRIIPELQRLADIGREFVAPDADGRPPQA